MAYDDDYDEDDLDAPQPQDVEELSAADEDGEAEFDTRRCPACGSSMHYSAEKCPRCGEWVNAETPAERRSLTWIGPAVIALLVLLLMAWYGLGR